MQPCNWCCRILKYYNWVNTTNARAVILDLSMLNPHDNLVTIWRGIVEMPPTGEVIAYDKSRTVKMFRCARGGGVVSSVSPVPGLMRSLGPQGIRAFCTE